MTAAGDWLRSALVADMRKAPPTHWPLGQTAICLDCADVFKLARECPGCGSRSVWNLSRWLEERQHDTPWDTYHAATQTLQCRRCHRRVDVDGWAAPCPKGEK